MSRRYEVWFTSPGKPLRKEGFDTIAAIKCALPDSGSLSVYVHNAKGVLLRAYHNLEDGWQCSQ